MNVEDFKKFVSETEQKSGYRKPLAFGICRVDTGKEGNVLQCHYPLINWSENFGSYAVFSTAAKESEKISENENEEVFAVNRGFIKKALELFEPFVAETLIDESKHKNIQVVLQLKKIAKDAKIFGKNGKSVFRFVTIFGDAKCASVESAYLKLMALSLGKAPLRSLNLDGIFGLMTNVAWSGNKPIELGWLRENEIALKLSGEFPVIDYVDKFPRYLMQVIPQFDNIRILNSAQTRFGAYLGTGGYTQMPGASYVNFNAGAMGTCMNEGRISSSVVIGKDTDVGGGASILGVLSGGNSEPISIGERCLLGANSVTGISLGDGCIVDAGVAVLAGTVFKIESAEAQKLKAVNPKFEIKESCMYKGRDLSGMNGLHFRQNSKNGEMMALRSKKEIELNKDLH